MPGALLISLLVNVIGRQPSLAIFFGLSAVTSVLCGLAGDHLSWPWLLAAACLLKLLVTGCFCGLLIYTSEAYPTRVRASALGFANLFTRIAGCITPLDGQILIELTALSAFSAFAVAAFVAMLAAIALPFDTWKRDADAAEATPRERTEASPLLSGPPRKGP